MILFAHTYAVYHTDHDLVCGVVCSLVTGRESDGVTENCELFLRSVVKSFPFIDAHLMQQMVMTLAKVKVGETPTALNTVCTSLFGLQFMSSAENVCNTCGDLHALRKCSVCKMVGNVK